VVKITKERAERIARAHACEVCGEYNYKKLSVKPADADLRKNLGIAWRATKTCGVCEAILELGINDEGDIIYVS
jgi:transcription elongation factor Elf1